MAKPLPGEPRPLERHVPREVRYYAAFAVTTKPGRSQWLRLFRSPPGTPISTFSNDDKIMSSPAFTNCEPQLPQNFLPHRWYAKVSRPLVEPVREFLCNTEILLLDGTQYVPRAPLFDLVTGQVALDMRYPVHDVEIRVHDDAVLPALIKYLGDEVPHADLLISMDDVPELASLVSKLKVRDSTRRLGAPPSDHRLYCWVFLEGINRTDVR
jgi:hypothetical protein